MRTTTTLAPRNPHRKQALLLAADRAPTGSRPACATVSASAAQSGQELGGTTMKALLTPAAVLATLVLAAPGALGADKPQGSTFITDTLGGNGGPHVALNVQAPEIRATDPRAPGPFITDTLGGNGHPKHAIVQGYRFITDTLGGNGGAPLLTAAYAPDASFNWADAAVGAATAIGSILLLLSGTFIALRKRGRLAL